MKVKISYYIPAEQEVEMTPEQYCRFHADSTSVIPKNAIKTEIILSKKAQEELDDYFFKKNEKRG